MKQNKLIWPMILGIIGSIWWIVVGYGISYFATGGTLGAWSFDFGAAWLWVTIIAMVSAIISIVGASITLQSPKVGGVMMLVSVLGYIVVSIIIGQRAAVPFLLFGSIGVTFLFISGVMCLIDPMMSKWNDPATYSETYFTHHPRHHHRVEDDTETIKVSTRVGNNQS